MQGQTSVFIGIKAWGGMGLAVVAVAGVGVTDEPRARLSDAGHEGQKQGEIKGPTVGCPFALAGLQVQPHLGRKLEGLLGNVGRHLVG